MYGYIYLTTNKINNKKYIGQHKSNKHDKRYLGSGRIILDAIQKYGRDNFILEILEWCSSPEQLNEREKYWISKHNAVLDENYYNLDRGGKGSHQYTCVEETKEKLSNAASGRIVINNGDDIKHIYPDELENYPDWVRGYPLWYKEDRKTLNKELAKKRGDSWKSNISKTITGKKWVKHIELNIEKQIFANELDDYLKNGWTRGRLFAKGKK